ncbi:uncharacterized protein LOC108040386 isoform X2 [Drosophila rhopaloa]|uniref:C2H2-type domain-containing protein n=1 Tax=Drosophila rhopaloa TaxID=1041015 RepID=A0ABM5J5P7_DRORH|nr:uncharacterized protein LOC108040386 isoform X2 [Drosophila rhopaloa]
MASEKYTPEIRELLPIREHRCIKCPNLVFGNLSHYQLHLRQRHQEVLQAPKSGPNIAFHCPVEKCIYHVATKGARCFTSLRLLRQHYQKSHLDRNHKCQECGEKFLLQHHLEKHQCTEHKCPVCELTYNSKAGLRTHMRRKNHLVQQESDKVAIPSLATWRKLNPPPAEFSMSATALAAPDEYIEHIPFSLEVATEPPAEPPPLEGGNGPAPELSAPEEHILCFLPIMDVPFGLQLTSEKLDMETQTEEEAMNDIRNEVLAPLLRDIETQTPDSKDDIGTMTDDFLEKQAQIGQPVAGNFPTYPNIETQTTDTRGDIGTMTDDFPEDQEQMGQLPQGDFPTYSHIEPQTTETRGDMGTMTDDFPEEQVQIGQPVPVASDFPTYPENEAMFGLQTSAHMYTQTCDELFEELGLSHIQTQTHWPDGLYNTQQTQTCDEMLEEFFLDNFQSTCTQTRWLDWQDNGEGES